MALGERRLPVSSPLPWREDFKPIKFQEPIWVSHFARALDSTEAHPASGKIQTQRRQRRYAIGQELQGGIVDLSLRDLTMMNR